MTRLIFLDTETTSLDRRKRRIWDIAYIIRDLDVPADPDIEEQRFVKVDLENADPMSLKIGGYYDRHPSPYRFMNQQQCITEAQMCAMVAPDFRDAIIVGAVPSFDEETLARAFRRHGFQPTWHYHLMDIESVAAGALGVQPPWDFDNILGTFGLEYDEKDRHTALGDARMVRDLYDAVMGRNPAHRLEHSTEVIYHVHDPEQCAGHPCTVHNMTNHSMRSFPQHFREDNGLMERMCPHGIGHPDPDSPAGPMTNWVHGCDGCCAYVEQPPGQDQLELELDLGLPNGR